MPVISSALIAGSVWASGGEGGGGGETAGHGVPFSYIVGWLMLLCVLAVGWRAYKKTRPAAEVASGESAPAVHRGAAAPALLMLVVAALFLTESLSAMGSYHESFLLAWPRFLLKMGGGVLLMFYGLSFMHGHDEH